jgi:2-polyprenyl-3-methyl-5-hydroxy-6-metoxy-1,4-benzoquinol methylase
MKLCYTTSENNPSIKAFINKYTIAPQRFNANIYAEDEVYIHGLNNLRNKDIALMTYFHLGYNMMGVLRKLVNRKFGALSNVESFLDFACGYGRLTRFLIQELPPSSVWVSDIYKNAVNYQRQEFGVNGFVSVTEPHKLKSSRKFDCIFVASLFSHLPEARFKAWFKCLAQMLSTRGMLIFSVHDEYILNDRAMPPSGFYFVPMSESKYLKAVEYGTAIVTEAFVKRVIDEAMGREWSYLRMKRGLSNHQDIYIVTQDPQQNFDNLDLFNGPEGHVDHCWFAKPGELRVSGWAGDLTPNCSISEVQLLINSEVRQRSIPSLPRPDVAHVLREPKLQFSGWECLCPMNYQSPSLNDIVEVKALSTSGVSYLMHMSTVQSALTE